MNAQTIELKSKVRDYIVQNMLLGADEGLGDDVSLIENGILDSTAAMELVAFLQATFGIEISDDEIVPENLNSVDNICNFVARKTG